MGPVLAAVLAITRRYLFFACLKHRGIRLVLCVCRQGSVSLCQLALAKLIKFVAADDKTKTTLTI